MNIDCYIDAEWSSSGVPLSLQVLVDFNRSDIPLESICVLNENFIKAEDLSQVVSKDESTTCHYIFDLFQGDKNILSHVLEKSMLNKDLGSDGCIFFIRQKIYGLLLVGPNLNGY